MKQFSTHILMVRPSSFRMNEQTAVNNYFQNNSDLSPASIIQEARLKFDAMVTALRTAGANIVVFDEPENSDTPDALFPNNWISMHRDGRVALYPMYAKNRREERREEVLDLLEKEGFSIEEIIDYTSAEEEAVFLEGTGSMILDHVNQIAYCALSERADEELFIEFCEDFEYTPCTFNAYQTVGEDRLKIYHTNVMMCVGSKLAVVCSASITDKKERKNVMKQLKSDAKELIDISIAQMNQFAGNMLEVRGMGDQPYLVMSTSAFNSLRGDQISAIEKHCRILHADLETIEICGGGSARCMMAEVFLPKS